MTEKYDSQAAGWTESAYADADAYLAHRAALVVSLGSQLERGETVLDLACGDGGLGSHLLARGLRYVGVDASAAMVAAAHARGIAAQRGDLNEWEPAEPVAATTVFRAIYYAHDRRHFFRRALRFTEKKLVFDLNPRQYRPREVYAELRAAGWSTVAVRPFFVPQTAALPAPAAAALKALERSGPVARALLRLRFTYVVAASR
jgi:SAM-dependent methyltransferase